MVQVGNETNHGIAGVTNEDGDWTDMCQLFSAGCRAVDDFEKQSGTDVLSAVHFTDPQTKGNYESIAKALEKNQVPYDVFASSYYPNIHGSMENLSKLLKKTYTLVWTTLFSYTPWENLRK